MSKRFWREGGGKRRLKGDTHSVLKQRTRENISWWPQRKPSGPIDENGSWMLLCWVHGPQISDSQTPRMRHDTQKLDADCFIGKWKIDCLLPWLSEGHISSYFLQTNKQKKGSSESIGSQVHSPAVAEEADVRAQLLTFSSSSVSCNLLMFLFMISMHVTDSEF